MSDLAKRAGVPCPLCADTGVMRWMQPNMDCTELREMVHPCVNGCGDVWRHPAAEGDAVVEEGGESAAEPDDPEPDEPGPG